MEGKKWRAALNLCRLASQDAGFAAHGAGGGRGVWMSFWPSVLNITASPRSPGSRCAAQSRLGEPAHAVP